MRFGRYSIKNSFGDKEVVYMEQRNVSDRYPDQPFGFIASAHGVRMVGNSSLFTVDDLEALSNALNGAVSAHMKLREKLGTVKVFM